MKKPLGNKTWIDLYKMSKNSTAKNLEYYYRNMDILESADVFREGDINNQFILAKYSIKEINEMALKEANELKNIDLIIEIGLLINSK